MWIAGASREYALFRTDFTVPPGRSFTRWVQIVRIDVGAATLYAILTSDNGIETLDRLRVGEPGWIPAPLGRIVGRQRRLVDRDREAVDVGIRHAGGQAVAAEALHRASAEHVIVRAVSNIMNTIVGGGSSSLLHAPRNRESGEPAETFDGLTSCDHLR